MATQDTRAGLLETGLNRSKAIRRWWLAQTVAAQVTFSYLATLMAATAIVWWDSIHQLTPM
ncbi:MAG TPA: hypothetical protein VGN26_12300 [Armatimonadota bacterium]|jgi:hypothetical protein